MTSVSRKLPSNKGKHMSNLLMNKKTAVFALAATAVLGGGAAFAYPAGSKLTVSATAAPSGGSTDVLVSIQNSNPSCSTSIEVEGAAATTFAPGQTSGHVTIPAGSGSRRVEARTVDCAKGSKEHAHANFSIVDAKATGPATTGVKQKYEVALSGLDQDSTVTSTATLTGSNPLVQLVDSDNVSKSGQATVKFKFKVPGTYTITTVISPGGGSVNPVTVTVS
jgi:hypothetical protein